LPPIARDIVEIFRVGADLLEQGPLRFDVRQVLFALIFAAAFVQQAVLAPDAFQSAVRNGQLELPDQAARAEGGQRLAELDELSFAVRQCLVRLMAASVTQFAYNSLGELTSITDPLNHVTALTYTTAGLSGPLSDGSCLRENPVRDTRTARTGKSMSRRSGQTGSIQREGKWYVVRWWMDVEGQESFRTGTQGEGNHRRQRSG